MIPEWNNITQQYELPSQSLWESLNPANMNVTGDWAYFGFALYDLFPTLIVIGVVSLVVLTIIFFGVFVPR